MDFTVAAVWNENGKLKHKIRRKEIRVATVEAKVVLLFHFFLNVRQWWNILSSK